MSEVDRWPVVVVGSGAAGMMAAIVAARAGARVLVLESRRVPGAKIRVSGGGRCNVLPAAVALEDYHTQGSAKAMRNILFSWPRDEVERFFIDDLGVPLVREATGKLFPASHQSRDIVQALVGAMQRAGVTLRGEARVVELATPETPDAPWQLALASGETLQADTVVFATGGQSMPKTGSDGAGWAMLRRLGHTVLPTHPGLVALHSADRDWASLAGLSLRARLTIRQAERVVDESEGDFLFTHHGFSGPVVLDVSRHFTTSQTTGVELHAHWAPAPTLRWDELLQSHERRVVAALVRDHLPRRLADVLVARARLPEGRTTSELARPERLRLVQQLERCPLVVTGSDGYRSAEVTEGGLPLDEVAAKTLESRCAPRLFIVGELLDVKGRIGGYNFLWAWVTGRKAGLAAAEAATQRLSSNVASTTRSR